MAQAARHIFFCYSSKDEATALEIVGFLEAKGLKCWISARDVSTGHNYQESIVEALEAAGGIVFLFSENSNTSQEIRKELSIGSSISVPIFPVRLTRVAPSGALRYELATRQWIDLLPNREQALSKLVQTIKAVMDPPAVADAPPSIVERPAVSRDPIVAPGSREFDAIRALLARHIGPIAKVLVEKAAREADSPDDFCARLAATVSVAERPSLVQAVKGHLQAKA